MRNYENIAFIISYMSYTAAILLYVWYFISNNESVGRWAIRVTGWGWGINTLALVLRAVNAGRLPFTNGYEFLIAFAWGIVLIYLWFEYRYRLKNAGLFVLPVVWLLMSYVAVEMPVSQRTITPLMPALKSNWLNIHVATAILSYGSFALSFGLAVMYLFKERYTRKGAGGEKLFAHLPKMELLDELCYKFITFGFFLLTIVIISGAIWAEQAWGSYWSWDPKETWSLITWLIYGACLHARQTYGWQGRRALVLAILGFAAVLFTFFGVNYLLAGLHSYA